MLRGFWDAKRVLGCYEGSGMLRGFWDAKRVLGC